MSTTSLTLQNAQMALREPRRSPRFRCLLLDLLEDDLLRLVLGQFEVRFDGGVSGRENGLQSEEAECCRQLSLTCRRISVALCFSSSARSLTEIPRSLAAVDDVLSRSMVLLGEAAKLQAALRALPPEVYHEPAENTRAALQVALLPTSTLLPTTHNSTHPGTRPAQPGYLTPCTTRPPHALRSPSTALQSGCTLHAPGDAAHARRHAGLSASLPDSHSPTLVSHTLSRSRALPHPTGNAAEARRHAGQCSEPPWRGHQVAAQVRGAVGPSGSARCAGSARGGEPEGVHQSQQPDQPQEAGGAAGVGGQAGGGGLPLRASRPSTHG